MENKFKWGGRLIAALTVAGLCLAGVIVYAAGGFFNNAPEKLPGRQHVSVLSVPPEPVEKDIGSTLPEASATKTLRPEIRHSLELKGTANVESNAACAVILDKKQQREFLVKAGDFIDGIKIKAILDKKVLLEIKGHDTWLFLAQRKPGQRLTASPPEPKFKHHARITWDDISRISENSINLERQIRFTTEFKKNQPSGVRITYLKKNGWFSSKIGLKHGDLITAVGGKALDQGNDLPNPYDLKEQLEAGSPLQFDILRNDLPGKIIIQVEEPPPSNDSDLLPGTE